MGGRAILTHYWSGASWLTSGRKTKVLHRFEKVFLTTWKEKVSNKGCRPKEKKQQQLQQQGNRTNHSAYVRAQPEIFKPKLQGWFVQSSEETPHRCETKTPESVGQYSCSLDPSAWVKTLLHYNVKVHMNEWINEWMSLNVLAESQIWSERLHFNERVQRGENTSCI